jgi:hypothetical protein
MIHKNVTGIRVSSTAGFASADIKNCNIENNATGVDAASGNSFVTVDSSRISLNSSNGVVASASGSNLTVKDSTLLHNGTAVNAAAGSAVKALSNSLVFNVVGFGGTTANIQTDGQNRNVGNSTPGAPGGGLVTIH